MDDKLIKDLAAQEVRRLGKLSRVAREFAVDYHELKQEVYGEASRQPLPMTTPLPKDVRQLGKPGMERYVVAAKPDGNPFWPPQFEDAINKARKLYDQGTHEMCQGLNPGGWVVLYLIPRKRKRNVGLDYFASAT